MCYDGGVTGAVWSENMDQAEGVTRVVMVVLQAWRWCYMCYDGGVTGAVWAHYCCAVWSENVDQADGRLQYVGRAVFNGLSQVSRPHLLTPLH